MDKIQNSGLAPLAKAMRKHEFFALAEKRIRDNAGSGFAEWGKSRSGIGASYLPINQGLYVNYTGSGFAVNQLLLGDIKGDAGREGQVSRTSQPIANINGVSHEISGVSNTNDINAIQFPPAPDGTKTYDSATGAVVVHASPAEAFEGLVTNGDFRDGTINPWVAKGATSTVTYDSGRLKVTGDINSRGEVEFATEIGKTYRIEISLEDGDATCNAYWHDGVTQYGLGNHTTGVAVLEITATTNVATIQLYPSSTSVTYFYVNSISVMPVTQSVITSRQDFVFLESWHEKISDKDIVYPYGNVQYGGDGAFDTVDQGYSAFGEWDTTTQGYGIKWSTMADDFKTAMLQDRTNNIYLEDGELIQVRYRIRVVEGLGDGWTGANLNRATSEGGNANFMHYSTVSGGLVAVEPKGQNISVNDLYVGNTQGTYSVWEQNNGAWKARRTYLDDDPTIAHNGLLFAIPIALVQRRNQGGNHPVYNPEGCDVWRNGANAGNRTWYHTDIVGNVHSSNQCFVVGGSGVIGRDTQGKIGNTSGRSDGKFYDAIYASDVQDLRMSSNRLPLAEIREKYKRDAIAGKVRGFEGVPFTIVSNNTSGAVGAPALLHAIGHGGVFKDMRVGDGVGVIGEDGVTWQPCVITKINHGEVFTYGHVDGVTHISRGNNTGILGYYIQKHSQANPTWTDIMGDPARIASTFPNGVEGQWIPKIETSGTHSFPLNRKLITNIGQEVTDDDGLNWSAINRTVDTTSNTLSTAVASTTAMLVHYETQAHFTEDDVNSKVLDLGGIHAGGAGNLGVQWGSLLTSSLINKIVTATGTYGFYNGDILTAGIDSRTGTLYGAQSPEHEQVYLTSGGGSVKSLDYLSSENGVAKLCYAYKEMVYDASADSVSDFTYIISTDTDIIVTYVGQKFIVADTSDNSRYVVQGVTIGTYRLRYLSPVGDNWIDDTGTTRLANWNGTGWGDNNQFEITDNQATQTDDNGNAVLYGTASFNTQYFIVEK